MKPQTLSTPENWLTRSSAARLAGVTMRTINRWKAAGLLSWGLGIRGSQPVVLYCPEDVLTAAETRSPRRPRVGQQSVSQVDKRDEIAQD